MTLGDFYRRCSNMVEANESCVVVTLVEAAGSTPADAGAKMIVTKGGRDCGTVGGGRVEAKALERAHAMLSGDSIECQWVDWNLKADVGMTCGGSVKLLFERVGRPQWRIVVFGAGHVAQELSRVLMMLPCRVTCIDSRAEWLSRLPQAVEQIELASPADYVDQLPPQAYVLCMTQGHRSDLPVLQELLRLKYRLPFVGVIGSRAKAAVLRKELKTMGIAEERLDFHCPVGLPIGTNHPGEIAISIAAQLLEVRDTLAKSETN